MKIFDVSFSLNPCPSSIIFTKILLSKVFDIFTKIFKRFYSNRPDKFGEHSGLGLNIVKNLVNLHDGEIVASNRLDRDGAIVEIKFPSV